MPVFPTNDRARKRAQDRPIPTVILEAAITDEGWVERPRILSSTAPGFGFEESALQAVEQWRYTPAMEDGEPVAVDTFTIFVQYQMR